ncbi:MAG: echA1 [Aeromicrobium sp.]|nr:echA1 [Aeromicrobium sp.]
MSVVLAGAADGIGRITLNRPEQMNAITVALGQELEAALHDLGSRADVSVVLIRGSGGNFSAGGDFHEVERRRAGGPDARVPLFDTFGRACRAINEVDVPVIVAVEGVAMAGGFELMQAADIALVRDDARIADNHVNFGQVPGGGGSQRLPRLVGTQRALGLLLSGDRLSGPDAVAWGLAYRSYPAEAFDDAVEAFVTKMAGRHRDVLVGIKRLIRTGVGLPLDDGLDLELRTVVAHISGDAGGDGVSAFTSKGA